MKFSDEMLMAYADGELDAATRSEIETAMAGDPELARAIERHRSLAARVRAGYADVAREPVPERLVALVAGTGVAPVIDLGAQRSERAVASRRWRAPHWAALAASVAVALLVGALLLREPAAPYEKVEGALVARGELEQALTSKLASRPVSGGVDIGISFRNREGDYCRTFHLQQDAAVAGLACRSGSEWKLRVLADAPVREGGVRAAAAMPIEVLQAVDTSIKGEPLDAAAEAAARDAGWRGAGNMAE